jgi:hypothetical protein
LRAGFPHSEIHGSKLACQLPVAYRRLQRPSSPVVAKASTSCTCSLDPITLSTDLDGSARNASAALPQPGLWIALGGAAVYKAATPITANAISYPDEPGLRDRIRFTSSELLKSSRMKRTLKGNARFPFRGGFRKPGAWWSQPGSNR